jgi:hypothetical protein
MDSDQKEEVSYKDIALDELSDRSENKNKAEIQVKIEKERKELSQPKAKRDEAINFSKNSYLLECPFCTHNCTTYSVRKASKCLYITSGLCCLFLPPFCFVPFLLRSCYDRTHFCSNCGAKIGTYKALSKT